MSADTPRSGKIQGCVFVAVFCIFNLKPMNDVLEKTVFSERGRMHQFHFFKDR